MARLGLCPDTSLVHLPSRPPNNSEFNYEVHFLLLNQQRSRDAVKLEVGNGRRMDLQPPVFSPPTRAFSLFSKLNKLVQSEHKRHEGAPGSQLGEHDIRQGPCLQFPGAWAPVRRGRCQGRPDLNTRQTPNHRRAPSESAARLGSLRLKAVRGEGVKTVHSEEVKEVKVIFRDEQKETPLASQLRMKKR